MDLGIQGKVALVAAASKGLGRAIATGLAAEGARVAICARTYHTLQRAAAEIGSQTGAEVVPVAADVSRPDDCRAFVEAAVGRWGSVDILVNNSGGPPPGPFEVHNDTAWAAAVESTLMNVVRLTRLVLPYMKAKRWGRIVNVESISVKQPVDNLLLSNSIRPAAIGLAKTLALELAPYGILVNNVCPGSHDTDRLRALAAARATKSGRSAEDELQATAATIPLGRLGRPDELANVAIFLCSERASYVTGSTILVDGGAYRGTL
jgi:3-oxoacyl-[acyl-carrier protein] reductase